MISIHPSAIENFNDKASQMVRLLKPRAVPPVNADASGPNPTGIPPAIITENDIVGEVAFVTTDYHGRPLERMFPLQGMQVGLQQSDYAKLIDLARAIQRLPGVRDFLSQKLSKKLYLSG
jgi:hypothetical protein